jgi:hypothetical protein
MPWYIGNRGKAKEWTEKGAKSTHTAQAIAEADEHLKSRADEAPSEVNGGRAGRVTKEEIHAAKQLIKQTRTQAEQARKWAEELQIQQQQAEEALQDLQQVDVNPDNFSSVRNRGGSFTKWAADWKRNQAQQNTAPDDWIDGYANGTLKPIYTAGSRSSVKADLEPFFPEDPLTGSSGSTFSAL